MSTGFRSPRPISVMQEALRQEEDAQDALATLVRLAKPVGAQKDTNPKALVGSVKPSLHFIPPTALLYEALHMEDGANKYGSFNWRKDPISASTYVSAAMRHLGNWWDGEELTSDTLLHNLGAVRANIGILIDAMECGTMVDDRPLPGKSSQVQDRIKKERGKP